MSHLHALLHSIPFSSLGTQHFSRSLSILSSFLYLSVSMSLSLSCLFVKMFNDCSFVIVKNTYLVLFYCTQHNYSNILFYFSILFFPFRLLSSHAHTNTIRVSLHSILYTLSRRLSICIP